MTFSIETLARHHDRSRFQCGSDALDRYIRRQASQDARRNVSRVFVAIPGDLDEIAAFYTLSAGSVERETLPGDLMKRLPRYPVPVALLGRLGVDRRWSGQGLGSALLIDALRRVRVASDTLAVYAVVVDAKDERARAFYRRFGFIELPDSAMRLFLPMSTINDLFKR
ncbi:MAG: GNAT family N-acetyltransferase [Thiotrichales bacterium]|nr:GNAT family N-acetyltransferase [Thiotrichales bacterium]